MNDTTQETTPEVTGLEKSLALEITFNVKRIAPEKYTVTIHAKGGKDGERNSDTSATYPSLVAAMDRVRDCADKTKEELGPIYFLAEKFLQVENDNETPEAAPADS
jgi:hypothetical protein